jgi:hypothetical protein
MGLMERIVLAPRSASGLGVVLSFTALFAVFALGAPPIVVIPIGVGGATLYIKAEHHFRDRRWKRRA